MLHKIKKALKKRKQHKQFLQIQKWQNEIYLYKLQQERQAQS